MKFSIYKSTHLILFSNLKILRPITNTFLFTYIFLQSPQLQMYEHEYNYIPMAFRFLLFALAISATVFFSPVSSQISSPCTPSMISTFTPCMNFVTNSSINGTSPTADCCNSLRSLMSNGKDCLCLITSGSMPFRIPINRTLAISLPRACNMPGVPLQCKAAGAPVPAPAPAPAPETLANGPSLSPNTAPSPSVDEPAPPEALSPRSPPGADETPTPPASTTSGGAPASNTGSRAGMTPSAAHPSYSISPLHLMAVLGVVALKYY